MWTPMTSPNDPTADVFIDGGKTGVNSVVTLDNSFTVGALTIDVGDTLNINDNLSLTVALGSFNGSGTITDNGTININAGPDSTNLAYTGAMSLSGSGTLSLNGGNARVYANNGGDRLTIGAGFTVAGQGQLGIGQSTFTNNGTVNANSNGNTLVIQPGASTADFTNGTTGLAEASNGGILQLNGNNSGVFANGTFQALASSQVTLVNGANVSGAILSTAGTGMTAGSITVLNSATLTNVTNNGNLNANDNSGTTLVGTFTNNGTFNVNSGPDSTNVAYNGATTLAGTGVLNLNGTNGRLYANNGGDTLTINAGATIAGAGNLGIGQSTFINKGTIDANSTTNNNANILDIVPGAGNLTFANSGAGFAEASAGGTLQLDGNNGGIFSGGTFKALTGSQVTLVNGANVSGAILTTSGTGTVTVTNYATLTNVTNNGILNTNDNSSTTLVGTLTNNGTINVNSGPDSTNIGYSGPTTLAGTGVLNLNGTNGRIYASTTGGDLLTINAGATIAGAGNLGLGQSTFTNNGTINANSSGNILDLLPGAGSRTFANSGAGFAEATGGGTLQLDGNNGGIFSGGTFEALTGSQVNLVSGASVSGAILTTAGTGTVAVLNSATLTNVTNNGTLNANDNSGTTLVGALTNNGTFNLNSGPDSTNIGYSGATTLAGTGVLNLNGVNGRLYASTTSGDRLTIGAGATIAGAGNLGLGQSTFTNNGTINANSSGNTLTIQPGASTADFTSGAASVNEATAGGILQLNGNNGGVFSAGTFEAFNGSQVTIVAGATVSGATLATAGTGTVTVSNSTLVNVINNGTLNVPDNTGTTLVGTLTNNGTFNVNSGPDTTTVAYSGATTLAGTGVLNLNGTNGRIYAGTSAGDLLTINAGATIAGAGNLGIGQSTFLNKGIVNANSSGNTLTIQPGAGSATFANSGAGFAEATGGGILQLAGNNAGIFSGGTFEALTGSQVTITNGADASGTILTTAGTGTVTVSNSTLTNVTNNGALIEPDNTTTELVGTLTNNGTFNVNSGPDTTVVGYSGATTLAGTGVLNLNGTNSIVYANTSAGDRLTINAGATIAGAGNLGIGQSTFTNNGTVNANSSGNTLTVQPGASTADFTNGTTGLTEATGGGTLSFSNNNAGTFTNNGTIAVISGSTGGSSNFSIPAGALTNYAGTTLTGGTYNVISTSTASTSTLSLGGGPIVTNAASVTLSGASTVFNEIGTLAANQGTFAVANGRNFTTLGALSNSGTVIAAGGSTLTVSGAFTQASTGVLTGGGAFDAADFSITGTVNPGGIVSTTTGLFADAAGTTTLDGNAAFNNTTFNYQLGSPTGTNDHLDTVGTLALSGKLNVTALGGFGTGTYDLLDYSVTDNPLFVLDHGTLTLGTLPSGYTYVLSYLTPGQVDLTVVQLAIPEPRASAFILGGAALLIGLPRLRRSRRPARS